MDSAKHFSKGKILAISFVTAAFAVAVGFAIQGHARARSYQQLLNNGYQHAFSELTTAVSEMDAALQKGVYATSPTLISSLCTEIFGKAMSAQMAIGELPYGNVELEQTASFIAKVGDYAMALSRSAAVNGAYSQQDLETLRALSESASSLSEMLNRLQGELYAGTVTLEDLNTVQQRLSAATEDGEELAGGSFQTIEADFPEVPTLIYDGPFSEHLASRSPKQLEGRNQVTQEEALKAAASFLELKPEIFTFVSAGSGEIPTYAFSALVDGGELYVEVTQAGGQILGLMNSRWVGEATLSREEGLEIAGAFLAQKGYGDLTPTYSILQDGALTVNFAAVQDGVVCYPDLIKVSVALDNGSLVGLECGGYLMNHTQRDLPAPAVEVSQAAQRISPDLSILSTALALIPTGGENEILCHEFKCQSGDGQHCIVYVNVLTGMEERILLLLEDESGTLVL